MRKLVVGILVFAAAGVMVACSGSNPADTTTQQTSAPPKAGGPAGGAKAGTSPRPMLSPGVSLPGVGSKLKG